MYRDVYGRTRLYECVGPSEQILEAFSRMYCMYLLSVYY